MALKKVLLGFEKQSKVAPKIPQSHFRNFFNIRKYEKAILGLYSVFSDFDFTIETKFFIVFIHHIRVPYVQLH